MLVDELEHWRKREIANVKASDMSQEEKMKILKAILEKETELL